ncbi:MAG: hypothetical protein WCF54_01580 [Terracidiphilus sp.]
MILWQHYVYQRGPAVHDLWDGLYEHRPVKLLYITGRGFDIRAQAVMSSFADNIQGSQRKLDEADLILVGFSGYQLSEELVEETERNASDITAMFAGLSDSGTNKVITIGTQTDDDEDLSPSNALRIGTEAVLREIGDHTDIVLDASSLPRVVYLALITAILEKLIPEKQHKDALWANGINFQVLVAEDAALDGHIRAEDPSSDLIFIPGFSSVLHVESVSQWPLVWFPMLGEGRTNQLRQVTSLIPDEAEICPVLPHPSHDPRRADRLLLEYREAIFVARQTPMSNILYAHESHPFEAYRQMLGAMRRYRDSMLVLGGCRLVVTPLASKLITIGAGLACFEMKPTGTDNDYGVAIPYAEPKRYVASREVLRASKPEISALLLTGQAYDCR